MATLTRLRLERARASKQFGDGKFRNPTGLGPGLKGPALPVLGEFFLRRPGPRAEGPAPRRESARDVGQGTFDLALHAWDEPAETLLALAEPARARVLTPMLGRPFEPAHVEGPTLWWRAVGAEAAPLPVPVSLGLP